MKEPYQCVFTINADKHKDIAEEIKILYKGKEIHGLFDEITFHAIIVDEDKSKEFLDDVFSVIDVEKEEWN